MGEDGAAVDQGEGSVLEGQMRNLGGGREVERRGQVLAAPVDITRVDVDAPDGAAVGVGGQPANHAAGATAQIKDAAGRRVARYPQESTAWCQCAACRSPES